MGVAWWWMRERSKKELMPGQQEASWNQDCLACRLEMGWGVFFCVCFFLTKLNMTNMMEEQSLRSEIGMRNNENYFPISNPHHDMQWIFLSLYSVFSEAEHYQKAEFFFQRSSAILSSWIDAECFLHFRHAHINCRGVIRYCVFF